MKSKMVTYINYAFQFVNILLDFRFNEFKLLVC